MGFRTLWNAVVIGLVAVLIGYLRRKFVQRTPANATPGSGRFFDDLASRYDVMNRVISLGFDRSWRTRAVAEVLPADSILDVSTGTGDVVRALLAHSAPPRRVVGIDPSIEMLRIARRKFAHAISDVKFIQASAESLPFDDGAFDAAIVSFGVRNFANRKHGLAELARVLRPGGKLAVLEVATSRTDGAIGRARNFFVTSIMPHAASLLSGHPFAYRYLSDSMMSFPGVPEFSRMLIDAGCADVKHQRMPPFGAGPDLYTCIKKSASGRSER